MHLLIVNILLTEKVFFSFYLSENRRLVHVFVQYITFSFLFLPPCLTCSYDAISQGDIKIKGSDRSSGLNRTAGVPVSMVINGNKHQHLINLYDQLFTSIESTRWWLAHGSTTEVRWTPWHRFVLAYLITFQSFKLSLTNELRHSGSKVKLWLSTFSLARA